jgi:hypothetical protein
MWLLLFLLKQTCIFRLTRVVKNPFQPRKYKNECMLIQFTYIVHEYMNDFLRSGHLQYIWGSTPRPPIHHYTPHNPNHPAAQIQTFIYTYFVLIFYYCSFSHIRLVEVRDHVALWWWWGKMLSLIIMKVAHPCSRRTRVVCSLLNHCLLLHLKRNQLVNISSKHQHLMNHCLVLHLKRNQLMNTSSKHHSLLNHCLVLQPLFLWDGSPSQCLWSSSCISTLVALAPHSI